MVINTLSMAAKIMSLYSITKVKGQVKNKNDGDLRFKIPRFSEVERGRAICMLMGGASHNAVRRHFNVHRTIVERFLRRLEKARPTRDRPYSGRP